MNVGIITARKGSKSIPNKNIIKLFSKELVRYPIECCLKSSKISRVFVSTDCPVIKGIANSLECDVIERPEHLCGDEVNHGDVIKHAVEVALSIQPKLSNIVLLIGNTVMIYPELIDHALTVLEKESTYDSVMTVWEAGDDHPNRALQIIDGYLSPYKDRNRNVSTERQSYQKAYFYDQGIWAFRHYTVFEKSGPNPWWWMGKKCKPIIRSWITGRDIHTEFDVLIHKYYLQHIDKFKIIEDL